MWRFRYQVLSPCIQLLDMILLARPYWQALVSQAHLSCGRARPSKQKCRDSQQLLASIRHCLLVRGRTGAKSAPPRPQTWALAAPEDRLRRAEMRVLVHVSRQLLHPRSRWFPSSPAPGCSFMSPCLLTLCPLLVHSVRRNWLLNRNCLTSIRFSLRRQLEFPFHLA